MGVSTFGRSTICKATSASTTRPRRPSTTFRMMRSAFIVFYKYNENCITARGCAVVWHKRSRSLHQN